MTADGAKEERALTVRVLIADDDPGVTAALEETLGADARFHLLGAAATGDAMMALARSTAPDLVLLDVRMPGGGLAAARRLRALVVPPTVVVFSATTSATLVVELLAAGVVGVLDKGRVGTQLTDLLVRCRAGEVVLATAAAQAALAQLLDRSRRT